MMADAPSADPGYTQQAYQWLRPRTHTLYPQSFPPKEPEMADLAQRRADLLDVFVEDVSRQGPDRRMLRIRAETLIKAAEKLERERWFPTMGGGLSDKAIPVLEDGQ
jgi:hypothetical protein